MNKIVLMGNIVKDAELNFLEGSGTAKLRFTMACNERLGKDKERVNFIPCTVWGAMAEGLAEYLVKGTKVCVAGRLDIDNVESTEYEGEWKTYVNVNVHDLDFCGGSKKPEEEEKPKKSQKERKERKKK